MDFGFPFVVPFRITKQRGVPSLQKRPAQFDPPTSLDILAGAMALAHACKLALLGQEGGRKVAGRWPEGIRFLGAFLGMQIK